MRTILHLSDLHFGSERKALLAPLIRFSHELKPDVVIISGDVTQRARKQEFIAAGNFLAQLPAPQIVVPGNHDIPLYNLFARFLRPLTNYRRYISANLSPSYQDQELIIAGVNTSRSMTFKDGRVNERQIGTIARQFSQVTDDLVKVVVSHHPFALPAELAGSENIVGRGQFALPILHSYGADLFLAGHLHRSEAGIHLLQEQENGRQILLIQAGTAISTRERGEENSFNVIQTLPDQIVVNPHYWQASKNVFFCTAREQFYRAKNGWNYHR